MEQDGAESASETLKELFELKEKGEVEEGPRPDEDSSEEGDATPQQILRVLREGSIKRWENRRDHEWKLNYAFWVALIGIIVLGVGKDFHLARPATWSIITILSAGFVLQVIYLWFITSRAIDEIEHQYETEKALRSLLPPKIRDQISEAKLAAGMGRRGPFDKHYGVIAPLGISLVLCVTAGWVLAHPPDSSSKTEPKSSQGGTAPGGQPGSNPTQTDTTHE